jgi:hypothetical protein
MYLEIAQPYAFLYNLMPALKRDARVRIVDLELPTSEHGTPIELLRCELTAVGYRAVATYKLAGGGGYLAVFYPPEVAGLTDHFRDGSCVTSAVGPRGCAQVYWR